MSAQRHHLIEQHCRDRLQALLDQLDLTQVTTIDQFCQAVGVWRQHPILLLPLSMPPGLTGLWLPALDEDIIAYAEQAPQLIRNQAIAHELAHLLGGHQAKNHTISPHILALFTHLAPTRIQELLAGAWGRTGYDSDEEYEAEFFGSLIEQALAELRLGNEPLPAPDTVTRDHFMQWLRDLRGAS